MSRYPKSVMDHLESKATQLHEAAGMLPLGDAREALVNRAIKIEAASLIFESWASSTGLRELR